jgi:hypothetical protein
MLKKWFDAIVKLNRHMFLLSRTKNKRIQNKLLKKIEKLNIEVFTPK